MRYEQQKRKLNEQGIITDEDRAIAPLQRALDHRSVKTTGSNRLETLRDRGGESKEHIRKRISLGVWACSYDAPTRVCSDARLRHHDGYTDEIVLSVDDTIYGQAGWDVGINFNSLRDLANKLESLDVPGYVLARTGRRNQPRRIQPGELSRLAINAHGVMGEVFVIDQRHNRPSETLNAQTARGIYRHDLERIGLLTPQDGSAVILLMGCNAGLGSLGTDLLLTLSREWPNRTVVAFISKGYAPSWMLRPGEYCHEPGMRDTTYAGSYASQRQNEQILRRYARNLQNMPWASEMSPSAKVALNGRIIRGNRL